MTAATRDIGPVSCLAATVDTTCASPMPRHHRSCVVQAELRLNSVNNSGPRPRPDSLRCRSTLRVITNAPDPNAAAQAPCPNRQGQMKVKHRSLMRPNSVAPYFHAHLRGCPVPSGRLRAGGGAK